MRVIPPLLVLLACLGPACPAAWADDEGLPPPRVVRRSGGSPAPSVPQPTATPAPLPGGAPLAPPPPPPGGARPVDVPAPRDGPTRRELQRRIDAYLGDGAPLFAPTSMPGVAGYDQGFRIRTGGFRLALRVLLQARYEAFLPDDDAPRAAGGDRSGFALPRARLRLEGTAEPNFDYRFDLAFDHPGADAEEPVLREGWVDWHAADALRVRGGLLPTPTTRQLMVEPDRQQFIDVALASAWTGRSMPGWSDRNRDLGLMLHGVYYPQDQLQWMVAIVGGDGGLGRRPVLDQRSSEKPAVAARLNWAFLPAIGYEEGALRQGRGRTYGEVGLWAYYDDDQPDAPLREAASLLRYGADVALGHGPWSFSGALTFLEDDRVPGGGSDEGTAWLVQCGHHLVGTPLEVAARWSGVDTEGARFGDGTVQEYALGLNYYLDGHRNKVQVDATWIDTRAGGMLPLEPYPGYAGGVANGSSAWLLRFQWQLRL